MLARSGVSESKMILLVDDNPSDEKLAIHSWRKNNVMNEVVVACDGAEALDYLFGDGSRIERSRRLPSLIVLDINLPKINGVDVLRRIRSEDSTKYIPVVIFTGIEDPEVIRTCHELGANSYLVKPVDAGEFSEMVLNIGMYWLLLNLSPNDRMPRFARAL